MASRLPRGICKMTVVSVAIACTNLAPLSMALSVNFWILNPNNGLFTPKNVFGWV